MTGLSLASYTAIVAGALKQVQHVTRFGIVLAALPMCFLVSSLVIGFLQLILDGGDDFTFGDLPGTFIVYEARVAKQRKQLRLPLVLLLLGLVAIAIVTVQAFRSSQIVVIP